MAACPPHRPPRVALLFVEPTSYILADIDHLRGSGLADFDIAFFESNLTAPWNLRDRTGGAQIVFESAKLTGRLVALGRLLRTLRAERYDAVLLNGYLPWYWTVVILWCALMRLPMMLQSDTQLYRDGLQSPLKRGVKRAFLPPLLSLVDCPMPAGTPQRRYFESYGVTVNRQVVQHMTVDVDWFSATAAALRVDRDRLRAELGFSPGDIALLYVGRFVGYKRVDQLVRAVVDLRSRNPAIRLLLVGSGGEEKTLREMAAPSGDGVVFAGFRSGRALVECFVAADIFVLPSEGEPWGLVVNEAMACGLPVITTTSVGAGEDLVIEGGNGLLVAPNAFEALVRAIDYLANNPARRVAMGRAAEEKIQGWTHREYLTAVRTAIHRVAQIGRAAPI